MIIHWSEFEHEYTSDTISLYFNNLEEVSDYILQERDDQFTVMIETESLGEKKYKATGRYIYSTPVGMKYITPVGNRYA